MKFTKEEFSEALKARMTANGKKLAVSDRTIKEHAERIHGRLERADNDDELNAVVEEYLADFEAIDGNIRKDNANFVKGWENDHKPTPDEPKPAPTPNGDGDKLDILMKEIQALKADIEARRNKADSEEKIEQIRKSLTEKGVKDGDWLKTYMKKLNVTKESDVDAEINDALELYNLSHAGNNDSINPDGSGKTTPKEDTNFDDVVSILKTMRGV